MPSPKKHKLQVLQDNLLTSMASQQRFLKAFPFLSSLKAVPKAGRRCGKCGTNNNRRAKIFTSVKQAIAGLSSGRKQQLKNMLNAERVRIVFVQNGASTQRTF